MKNVKYLELVLENCEVIKFNAKHIKTLEIKNIKKEIQRIAFNSILEYIFCEDFIIQISSKANTLDAYETTWGILDNRLPFERINDFKDIAAIDVCYDDDTTEYIYVNWSKDSGTCVNSYQSSHINKKTGDLFVVVSKDKNVQSVFGDELDKEDYVWKRNIELINELLE